MLDFSNKQRATQISSLAINQYDLIVIGGGITGAGIALDAASRGLKVVLFEKGDFASGTSSKSTKLIHGGLRYLKQFDFWLVKEVGSERAIVHKLAPHLVLPEKMLLPLIDNGSYGKWLTSIGLKVYDILAQVSGDDKRKMLDKKEALALEPLLPKKILKGAGYYAEYRTDDARLTIENIKTAVLKGATALNYSKVTEFIYKNNQIAGVCIEDQISGETYKVKASYVISAAGPWVDDLRALNNSKEGKRLHLTKGVHLVFPFSKLPIKQSVYFDIPDGRMMFAIPRGKITYVGTTDTNFNKDKDQPRVSLADAIYLISAVNNMFPKIHLELEDIVSSWVGLRPLIHEEGKAASELSRKDEIFTSGSGLFSIAGGKLTGYRKMAERVLDKVIEKLPSEKKESLNKCQTAEIPLCGNGFKNSKAVQKYIEKLSEQLEADYLTHYEAWHLVTNYGLQAQDILEIYNQQKQLIKPTADYRSHSLALLLAELQFGLNYEMVCSPEDFYIRRSGRLYFDIESISSSLEAVLKLFKDQEFWTEAALEKSKEALEKAIEEHSNFSMSRPYEG